MVNYMDRNEIRTYLKDKSDEKYRDYTEKIVPGDTEIWGVRTPDLKKLVKSLSVEDKDDYLQNLQWKFHEEELINGMVIASMPWDIEKMWPYIELHSEKMSNWAVCDSFCSHLKIVNKNHDYVWEKLMNMELVGPMSQRFIIVMLKTYFLTDEYYNKAYYYLKTVKDEDYYIKMAIAWTLTEMLIKDEKRFFAVWGPYAFSPKIRSYFYQKCRDSRRITKSTVEKLNEYENVI